MLERYYANPSSLDRIRALWLGPAIDRYADWLEKRCISSARARGCIEIAIQFNQFAQSHGAQDWGSLPALVDSFVESGVQRRSQRGSHRLQTTRSRFRVPVEQLLRLIIPGYEGTVRRLPWPFSSSAPRFPDYLREERGLRWPSIQQYAHSLRSLERYLAKVGVDNLCALTPQIISEFLIARGQQIHRSELGGCGSNVRVFLRYLQREGILAKDLSRSVPRGRVYKNAGIPRAIPWSEVQRTVTSIDRRSPIGKRDYAIFLLLTTYALRANEIASLQLDDIDWRSAQLRVGNRKAGNTTTYPLAGTVGDAIVTYLREARPKSDDRHVFLIARAPFRPLMYWDVSQRAQWHLDRAGVQVSRAGSHTLRHSCAQRLVEADVPFKIIGDYVGHQTESATQIYAKVAVNKLRQLTLGQGEDFL